MIYRPRCVECSVKDHATVQHSPGLLGLHYEKPIQLRSSGGGLPQFVKYLRRARLRHGNLSRDRRGGFYDELRSWEKRKKKRRQGKQAAVCLALLALPVSLRFKFVVRRLLLDTGGSRESKRERLCLADQQMTCLEILSIKITFRSFPELLEPAGYGIE